MLFSKNYIKKREEILIFSISVQDGKRVRLGLNWGFEMQTVKILVSSGRETSTQLAIQGQCQGKASWHIENGCFLNMLWGRKHLY